MPTPTTRTGGHAHESGLGDHACPTSTSHLVTYPSFKAGFQGVTPLSSGRVFFVLASLYRWVTWDFEDKVCDCVIFGAGAGSE